jgi:putative flippase GtrA
VPARAASLGARLPRGLGPFLVVGSIGFGIDAALLAVLAHGLGLNLYLARLAAFGAAVSVTYLLNRAWSFRRHASRRKGPEYARYVTVQAGGVAINFLVFALAVEASATMAAYPVLALAAGSGVAMGFTYLGARIVAFRGG